MNKKNNQIGIRLDDELHGRIKSLEKSTGLPSSTFIRMLIEAALDYFDREGQIVFPIACIPKKELADLEKKAK